MPRVIKVIESHVLRGEGLLKGEIKHCGAQLQHTLLEDDRVRAVIQYHTLDGEFLTEIDPRTEKIINDFTTKEEKTPV